MRSPRVVALTIASVLAATTLAPVGGPPAAEALSPDVVVSQVYGGGGNAGAFYRYDFIELHNRGTTTVQLSGWNVWYASSTGNFGGSGLNTPLAGFIAPGEYYLIQQASGANTAAANLPTPDAIGTIAMAGASGKVALTAPTVTCTGTTCAGNTDLVGYGAANGFETAPTALLTNTTAAIRQGTPRGTTETDNNSTDFATGAPVPASTGRGFFSCSTGTVAIAAVQGAGASSPCTGQVVTVEGVVTGWDDKRGQSAACALFTEDAGIWIQTPDATNDGNPATSDGIFVGRVFPRTSYPLGTLVRVTGTVEEKFGLTQITSASLTPTIVSSGNPLPTPVAIDPVAAQAQALATRPYYESLEGTRVVVTTGVANSGGTNRFGELFLEPGAVPIDTLLRTSSTARQAALLGTADDAGAGDPAVPRTNPPSTTEVLADKGDTITGLTGPLTFSFSNYKVMPQIGALPTVTDTGATFPYDGVPTAPAGSVRVASFNLENYFPTGGTLDCTTVSAGDNADKTDRLSDAIGRLLRAPDVIAVQEVVDLPTLQQLATQLGLDGHGTYTAHLVEGNDNRGIDNGFLTKSTVTVLGVTQYGKTQAEAAPFECTSDIAGLLFDRPPLVLEFTAPGLVGTHAVVSNHFASKANPNELCRAEQAAFNRDLAATLRTAGRKVIVTGDINAFEDEPALTTLTAPGTNLTNLWGTAPADQRYSFQFNGLLQTLDHLIVDDGVLPSVSAFQYARLNPDYYERATLGDGHHVSDHGIPLVTLGAAGCGVPTGHAVSGFDCRPDLVVTQGSSTLHPVATLLSGVYNRSAGCATNNTIASYDDCVAGQSGPGTGGYANWDHDLLADAYPVGSASGRGQLTNPALVTNPGDLVRSASGAGPASNTDWAFGSEGIAIVAVNPAARSRTTSTLNVTVAQLQAVFEDGNDVCESTVTWAALGDTGPNAADLVLPFGMNTGSGTFELFDAFVGGGADTGDCLPASGYVPAENDVANLKAPTADAATAARFTSGQGLWWMAGSVVTAYPQRSAGLSAMPLGGVAFTSTTYGLRRTVSYVTRDVDAAFCTGAGAPIAGCTVASASANYAIGADNVGGKAGAAREFIRFVCRLNRHLGDVNTQTQSTAVLNSSRVTGAIQQSGFSTTVTGANFGRCRGSSGVDAPVQQIIDIDGFLYSPSTKTVRVGDTVVWRNVAPNVPHNVFRNAPFAISTEDVDQGQSTTAIVATTPGTFDYICSIHGAGMAGTLIVEA